MTNTNIIKIDGNTVEIISETLHITDINNKIVSLFINIYFSMFYTFFFFLYVKEVNHYPFIS